MTLKMTFPRATLFSSTTAILLLGACGAAEQGSRLTEAKPLVGEYVIATCREPDGRGLNLVALATKEAQPVITGLKLDFSRGGFAAASLAGGVKGTDYNARVSSAQLLETYAFTGAFTLRAGTRSATADGVSFTFSNTSVGIRGNVAVNVTRGFRSGFERFESCVFQNVRELLEKTRAPR